MPRYRVFFQPVFGSPGERLHIFVSVKPTEPESAEYAPRQFISLADLERTLMNLGLQAKQITAVCNNLSEGRPCELGGITGVPYHVEQAAVEALGLLRRAA
jgi:hypothetical protein